MSEKTWLQSSNMLTDGYGTVYYARTVKDARRLWEILVSQTYGLNALTSERDEAVRVAGELRVALEKLGRRHCMASLQGGVSAAWKKVAAGVLDHVPEPEVAYLGDDRWECSHEVCAEVRALLDSLTASTGGSSDEPQKEIRE